MKFIVILPKLNIIFTVTYRILNDGKLYILLEFTVILFILI